MKTDTDNTHATAPLLCAAAHALPDTPGADIMYMPGGLQTITPFGGGIGRPITVLVDAQAATALQNQLIALEAKGRRPYFDFEHQDGGASFWPAEFLWRQSPAPGVYARGEWTAAGREGVAGRTWRQFSPVFHVTDKSASPARIICNTAAKPNMGGLVNDPAFCAISPLWARNATGAQSGNQHTNKMDNTDIQALQDKITELETEIARLKAEQAASAAKGQTDEIVSAKIEAKEAALKYAGSELELAALKAKAATQDAEIHAQRATAAKTAVAAAVTRGAIAAKDAETIAAWENDITADPARAALLAKMLGQPAFATQRMTQTTAGAAADPDPSALLAKFQALPRGEQQEFFRANRAALRALKQ